MGTLPDSAVAEGDEEEEEAEEEYRSPYSSSKPMLFSISCKADRFGPSHVTSSREETDGRTEREGMEWRVLRTDMRPLPKKEEANIKQWINGFVSSSEQEKRNVKKKNNKEINQIKTNNQSSSEKMLASKTALDAIRLAKERLNAVGNHLQYQKSLL